jgi:hypothetical protein
MAKSTETPSFGRELGLNHSLEPELKPTPLAETNYVTPAVTSFLQSSLIILVLPFTFFYYK